MTAGASERWTDLRGEWATHEATLSELLGAVQVFNDFLAENGVQAISVRARTRPVS